MDSERKANAALALGIISLLAWLLPCIGFPVAIAGLVLGAGGLDSPQRNTAITGMVLCVIGLVAATANAAIGAYLGAHGRLFR